MRVSHVSKDLSALFDDPNLVSCGGLAPAMALARRAGLHDLVADRVALSGDGAANPQLKVPALVAGMVAGADSIDDMDLLRHGGMDRLFAGVRAPSTLGTFLRGFTHGHVRQLDSVAAALLTNLAHHSPLLPDLATVAYVDIDDTVKATYGYAKQGAGYGYSGVKGLNALLVTISTPTSAPVIAAARLRSGATNSARGAASLLASGLATAKGAGATGMVIARGDSAYYNADIVAVCRRAGARFSITARMDPRVQAAIAGVDEAAWIPISYPNAIWDEDEQQLISDAEVAEVSFTAFTSRRKDQHVHGRLIVRRVKRLNPTAHTADQGELFAAYRHHAVFTDTTLPMLQAETTHRGHAIIETVHADLKSSALAHLPSAVFNANAAWLVLATIAFNLTRATGCLASAYHAKATTATIRRHLINVPARLARSARRLRLHLPRDWPWEHDWTALFNTACGPPPPAAAT